MRYNKAPKIKKELKHMRKAKMNRKARREAEKKVNYFFEFRRIIRHYFRGLTKELEKMNDPRHQSYIKYPAPLIILTLIMKQASGLVSMRQTTEAFNTDEAIANMGTFLDIDIDEIPHYDTINNYLKKLSMEELERLRYYMVRELIKKRSFDSYRFSIDGDYYWVIVVDGTGLHTFKEKHCEHCLKTERKNKTTGEIESVTYYHHVLEAKLIVNDMVISIASEYIENEDENVEKQDCELKAFYRLAEKIKKAFPRLKICILADSLYAGYPVFEVCRENKWKHAFRFKDGSIPTVAKEYGELKELKKEDQLTIDKDQMRWVNGIKYRKLEINLCELVTECEDEGNTTTTKTFVFLTNFEITEKNIERVIKVGRSRWKVENEGFNRQKNHRLHIEHVNCFNYTAMKNHYLIAQITEIILVLYENGSECFKILKKTIKEKSSDLLEAFRTKQLTAEDFDNLDVPIQVRFT